MLYVVEQKRKAGFQEGFLRGRIVGLMSLHRSHPLSIAQYAGLSLEEVDRLMKERPSQ